MNEAQFSFKVDNEHTHVLTTLFYEMKQIGDGYEFELPENMTNPERLSFFRQFEVMLERPATCYGMLVVWSDSDRPEKTEMIHRGMIGEVIYEKQFFWWNPEKQMHKREAIINFCAASLQLKCPMLDFAYCQEIARDEIALKLAEKQPVGFRQIFLESVDQRYEIFSGQVDLETRDGSGFGMRLKQGDGYNVRRSLSLLAHTGQPVRLVAR